MSRRTLKLVFEAGTEFAGREVRIESMSMDEWLEARTWSEELDFFCERLVSWNWLDDDGHEVPPTREGLGSLDASDARSLVAHYNREAGRIRPLGQGERVRVASNGQVDETAIPMSPIPEG